MLRKRNAIVLMKVLLLLSVQHDSSSPSGLQCCMPYQKCARCLCLLSLDARPTFHIAVGAFRGKTDSMAMSFGVRHEPFIL